MRAIIFHRSNTGVISIVIVQIWGKGGGVGNSTAQVQKQRWYII